MDRETIARQLATLLATSDTAELEEVVARWKAGAPSEAARRTMEEMGARILDVKRALASAPKQPDAEDLTEILRLMLLLASDPEAVKPGKEPR